MEVFLVALGLGLTSFGGPIAHLGYFERTYVQRRRWLSAEDYAGLVALCQMIPGPASSQLGFIIGLRRAGWGGGLAAWLGFTLPSALLMFAFARLAPQLTSPAAQAALHGLKLVAVAVVAQAVLNMGRKLCPDPQRAAIALLASAVLLVFGGAALQFLVLAVGAAAGVVLSRNLQARTAAPSAPVSPHLGGVALAIFALLLMGFVLAPDRGPGSLPAAAAIFYKAGALVFGGGHVVLPLLRDALTPTEWLSDSEFLAGYGAAQAAPGPLFAFAAYLGAVIAPGGSGPGAVALWSAVATIFLFLPGLLLAVAGVPLWNWVGGHAAARGALAGVNAAVVGVLAAALYHPIWTSAVLTGPDVVIVLAGFLLLALWRVPPIVIILVCVAAAIVVA
jgi:chromate transporter